MGGLNEQQWRFCLLTSYLIQFANLKGYHVRYDDTYATSGHKINSKHYHHLAVDLPLFKVEDDGKIKYFTKTEDYKFLGDYWEGLDPECVWGGRWDDGNHFQYTHG